MRHWRSPAALLAGVLLAFPALAESRFDYWMLALSWSPEYCNSRGSLREPQCERQYQFVVHGLWPQHERGYPKNCGTEHKVPEPWVQRMLPLMPSERLVQHQWHKHGSCSGLGVEEYFLQTERAWRRVAIPPTLQAADRPVSFSRSEIERQFVAANPGLTHQGVALQCAGPWLREVRVCLDPNFGFRDCGADIRDRCGQEVRLRPNRRAPATLE